MSEVEIAVMLLAVLAGGFMSALVLVKRHGNRRDKPFNICQECEFCKRCEFVAYEGQKKSRLECERGESAAYGKATMVGEGYRPARALSKGK